MRVIIAAAGTAGHINPGLAIANKIKEEQSKSEIIFIGTTRGLENDLVPRAGYELKTIDAYGLSKKISLDNLKKMYKTYKGLGQAKKIIKDFKPDIVIGTGGYICGAVITSANKLGIPTMLHESNAFPGKAVKMLAKRTDTILVSFQDAKERIPNAKKIVCTGTPVKIKKQNYGINEKNEIINKVGLNSIKPIILVYGGSQGAQKINEALIEIIEKKLNKDYQVIWATGPNQYDIIKNTLKEKNINIENIDNMKVMPYIYNMEEIMNISDLIVARSGAMTITEISNLGKASILVPLPNVSNNHQMYNAKVLEKIDAAKIIENDNLNGELLNKTINEIVLNKDNLKLMGSSAFSISINDTQDKIYQEILALLNKESLK
ncbi:MAG: undecaprenyldiphospho-muramoylpentapeptide beta-N-acetylglucosaminyltransferase [Clostridia bacterium]|nr:undecaprenyldiphospho-muramoylpentapeptide beta-N-acetylglucosaminyltransferase [Clostridia bacterium]